MTKRLLSVAGYSAVLLRRVVNYLQHLTSIQFGKQGVRRFSVNPRHFGQPIGFNYDDVEELIEGLEGARHK